MSRAFSFFRLFVAALTLGAGGWISLVALAMSESMPWKAAVTAAAALLAWLMWRLRRPMKEAAELAHAADQASDAEILAAVRTPEIIEIAAGLARARASFRNRAEELVRRLAAAEGILEALPDPILLLDGERRVVRANSAARKLLGVDPTGNDLAGFLRAPAVLDAARTALADGRAREVDYRVEVPEERHFSVLIAPIAGVEINDGPRAVVRLVDLTAVKRAEEMRADFAANASHELKTPLSALIGFIETLRGPARDDAKAQERFLGLMAAQAERMARLVNDLLALSSIEQAEQHAPPTTPVALAPIARNIAQALEIRAQGRKMHITVSVDDHLPTVAGDAEQLSQLIQNLLDNALKYGAAGTEVALKLAPVDTPSGMSGAGKALAISVTDHGDGIPPEHIPRLTERFYRVDSARSREAGGTGLGLAIVKHVIGRHRGLLKIDSTIGVGSIFTAYLPARLDA
jgi:two-component system, OmpR family, phosphate regulon sensor histidine kinase PhoR